MTPWEQFLANPKNARYRDMPQMQAIREVWKRRFSDEDPNEFLNRVTQRFETEEDEDIDTAKRYLEAAGRGVGNYVGAAGDIEYLTSLMRDVYIPEEAPPEDLGGYQMPDYRDEYDAKYIDPFPPEVLEALASGDIAPEEVPEEYKRNPHYKSAFLPTSPEIYDYASGVAERAGYEPSLPTLDRTALEHIVEHGVTGLIPGGLLGVAGKAGAGATAFVGGASGAGAGYGADIAENEGMGPLGTFLLTLGGGLGGGGLGGGARILAARNTGLNFDPETGVRPRTQKFIQDELRQQTKRTGENYDDIVDDIERGIADYAALGAADDLPSTDLLPNSPSFTQTIAGDSFRREGVVGENPRLPANQGKMMSIDGRVTLAENAAKALQRAAQSQDTGTDPALLRSGAQRVIGRQEQQQANLEAAKQMIDNIDNGATEASRNVNLKEARLGFGEAAVKGARDARAVRNKAIEEAGDVPVDTSGLKGTLQNLTDERSPFMQNSEQAIELQEALSDVLGQNEKVPAAVLSDVLKRLSGAKRKQKMKEEYASADEITNLQTGINKAFDETPGLEKMQAAKRNYREKFGDKATEEILRKVDKGISAATSGSLDEVADLYLRNVSSAKAYKKLAANAANKGEIESAMSTYLDALLGKKAKITPKAIDDHIAKHRAVMTQNDLDRYAKMRSTLIKVDGAKEAITKRLKALDAALREDKAGAVGLAAKADYTKQIDSIMGLQDSARQIRRLKRQLNDDETKSFQDQAVRWVTKKASNDEGNFMPGRIKRVMSDNMEAMKEMFSTEEIEAWEKMAGMLQKIYRPRIPGQKTQTVIDAVDDVVEGGLKAIHGVLAGGGMFRIWNKFKGALNRAVDVLPGGKRVRAGTPIIGKELDSRLVKSRMVADPRFALLILKAPQKAQSPDAKAWATALVDLVASASEAVENDSE